MPSNYIQYAIILQRSETQCVAKYSVNQHIIMTTSQLRHECTVTPVVLGLVQFSSLSFRLCSRKFQSAFTIGLFAMHEQGKDNRGLYLQHYKHQFVVNTGSMETAIVPMLCRYTKKRHVHKQHLQMQKAHTFQTKSTSAFISGGETD